MLTKPETGDIQTLKNLWKCIFKDTDEYINLFFNYKFDFEKTFVYKTDNKIVSALYYFDVILTNGCNEFKAAYICGIATLPAMRGKGIAGKLIETCIGELKEKDYDIALLIPANESLFNYYKKFGFNKFSYISCWESDYNNTVKPESKTLIVKRTDEDIKLLKECYGSPIVKKGISYYKTNKNEYTAMEYTEQPGFFNGKTVRTAYNPQCSNSFPFSAAINFKNIELPEKKYINLLLN